MATLKPSVATFAARQRKGAASWDVRVSWPNGSSAVVPGFASDTEASRWIETKSIEWLRARQTGSHDAPRKGA